MKNKQEKKSGNVIDFAKYKKKAVKNKKTPAKVSRAAEHAAQECIYDAWEAYNKKTRISLAKEALTIFPDCADAYNLLAEDAAKSLEESKEYYRRGMEAGRRALGEKIFKEDSGYFWGMLETRPYMRARAGMMECLWEEENHDEAIGHAWALLRLNTNDNQGIRYILITYLACLGRYDELEGFMNGPYKDDGMAEWLYTKALLLFVKKGGTSESRKALFWALKSNKHVPKYLTGKKKIPRYLPDSITVGGEDEAYCYAAGNIPAWEKVPGALAWLEKQATDCSL
ncbi:hypothetical protein ASZ90_006826 [hydrocarbon metagenome]|uniref:ST7 protein n=1 Tax=hydrocarbon metagenome TaxID=938273 RepID=A0A0W8FR34_9ZZZZ